MSLPVEAQQKNGLDSVEALSKMISQIETDLTTLNGTQADQASRIAALKNKALDADLNSDLSLKEKEAALKEKYPQFNACVASTINPFLQLGAMESKLKSCELGLKDLLKSFNTGSYGTILSATVIAAKKNALTFGDY